MLRLLAAIAATAAVCAAASLSVHNQAGGIEVVVTASTRLSVDGRAAEPFVASRDIDIVRSGDNIRLEVRPRDTPLDLIVRLPLGFALEAVTGAGSISVEGIVHLAHLETDTGAILLKIPERGTRLTLDAEAPPAEFEADKRMFRATNIDLGGGRALWRLRDRMPEISVTYGDYRIKAQAPRRVQIAPFLAPAGWPLRFHWDALEEIERLSQPAVAPSVPSGSSAASGASEEAVDELVFRSDVRMVNLTMAVSDADGHPAANLSADRFRVVENGVEQRIAGLQAGDAAFNLVVLLDMSGSAAPDLKHMRAAAARFVDMARPGDRVAIYALSQGMFQVVSPLSSDHQALVAAVRNLPVLGGASPVYDVVTLAYAQELRQLPDERNALIVITDGLDNQITNNEAPSAVKFKDLKRAAEEMHAIIYPVLLLSGQRFKPSWAARARERMEELALASGGRLFPARDISDLEPVFPLIEADLRSVYSLSYYPDDQNFDGSWRAVEISVDEPGAAVRARPGYYAN